MADLTTIAGIEAELAARRLPGMIANGTALNGKTHETLERLAALEEKYFETRKDRDAKQTYLAGETDRMNPVPQGIDPLGAGADSRYRTERSCFKGASSLCAIYFQRAKSPQRQTLACAAFSRK